MGWFATNAVSPYLGWTMLRGIFIVMIAWQLPDHGQRGGQDSLILPIPLHRFRLLRRKYNQAALLSAQISAHFDAENLPNGLVRNIKTKPLEGKNRTERFSELQGAISVNSKHLGALKGRHVVLVDDVMTSGATFAAAADACINAGADDVCVLALARVMKDG